MDTSPHKPDKPVPPSSEESIFRDLRARNDRRLAMKQLHAERKQRVERVLEAARAHARRAKTLHSPHAHARSD